MTHLTRNLADILTNVCRPGDFSTTGRCEIFAPRLEVDGVGLIALPLLPAQAEALVAVAEQAPYGRGSDTLIDTAVRRTWQIGAERVQLGGRHWDKHLAEIVARCKAGLGVSEPVSAELYKLLIYDTGSFFVSHRDTEKAAGMFATLVVVLPSTYTGGDLCIRHRDREVCLDLSSPEPSEVAYAAFYADCRHEVRPITAGCRLVLIYNLIRHGLGQPPEPPAYDAEVERIGDLLSAWAAEPAAAEQSSPSKLIYPLEHAYTPAEIGFQSLKGADAAVASVLVSAAGRANCELHLAFLTIRESGSAEYYGSWSRGRRGSESDDDDFEVIEVSDRARTLSDWQAPDGSRPSLGEMAFAKAELSPPGAMEGEEPDEQHFFEATGNEGASFERSYRRAALVLWPQAGKLQVIATAGHAVSLPYLAALTQRWLDSGEDKRSPLWQEAQQLARQIIARREDWPTSGWLSSTPTGSAPTGSAAPLLSTLRRAEDVGNIEALLAEVSAEGCYDAGDNEALADAAMLLPPDRAAELVQRIIARNAPRQVSACGELLQRMAAQFLVRSAAGGRSTELLEPAAQALLAALPGDPAAAIPMAGWQRPLPVTPALVVDLLTALCHLGVGSLGERAVDHLLNWPDPFALDTILVPAACLLTEQGWPASDWAPTRRLRDHCLDHLARRIAEPLVAPVDFARPSRVDCRCADCRDLSAFLADPLRSVWVFKAAQKHRSHVEYSIRRDQCDVSYETERRGSPHALVCTKSQASFERRVLQRQKDLGDQARLRQPCGQ